MTPPIGTKGRFNLKPPHNNFISNVQAYEVVSVDFITELEVNKIDVLTSIYTPLGLTVDNINSDRINKVPIVCFLSVSNQRYYIPSNLILSIPIITGTKYQGKVLGINLGQLLENFDLSSLKEDIKLLITEKIGIIPKLDTVNSTAVTVISNVESKTIENKRKLNLTNTKSYKQLYTEEKLKYNELLLKTEKLECYIKSII